MYIIKQKHELCASMIQHSMASLQNTTMPVLACIEYVGLYCLIRYGNVYMFTRYLLITNNNIPVYNCIISLSAVQNFSAKFLTEHIREF